MSRPVTGRRPAGQGVVEYLLLISLLGVVAVCVLILAGPGIDGVYRGWVEREAGFDLLAGRPPSESSPAMCAVITVYGEARLTPAGDSTHLRLGGASDCSLIVAAAGGASDPLVLDPLRFPPRIHCVQVEDLALGAGAVVDDGNVVFPVVSAPTALRIVQGRNGPALAEISVRFKEMVVRDERVGVRAVVDGVRVMHAGYSPELAALAAAIELGIEMTLRPEVDAGGLVQWESESGRWMVQPARGFYSLRLTFSCPE